jgi:preprotein translocase subunit SecY
MNVNLRTVKSRLNNIANFLVMVMVVALLVFVVYLSRQNRRVRREYNRRMFTMEKKINQLQHRLDKKDFIIEQLRGQLRQLKGQDNQQ